MLLMFLCTKPLPPNQQKEAGNHPISSPVAKSSISNGLQTLLL